MQTDALHTFITKLLNLIIQPLILLLFALAMFYFVNGLAGYIMKADDPKERAKGSQHMLWGVVGFFIMASVILILRLLTQSFGIHTPPGTL